ncbi:hypothetical protein [Selenomonas sp.]|jgi:hypothetical protein|uniref:hypothetical protein n=1 Tax=Selenomonas sp. TaxID=2053611 RepID=UPI003A0FF562
MAGTSSTTPELLQEGAGLLKQELLLGTEALQAAQALRQALQDTAAGRGTGAALLALEAVLGRLREFHRRLDGFLARAGAERLTAFFARSRPRASGRARSRFCRAPRPSSMRCGASSRRRRPCSSRARRSSISISIS